MTAPLHLDSLFPSLDAIPEQYRPDAPSSSATTWSTANCDIGTARWRRYAARYSSPRPTASAR